MNMTWNRFFTGATTLAICLQLTPLIADPIEDRFNFATGLLIKEEYELAAEEFGELLLENPKMKRAAEATFRLGECHWKLKQKDLAQAAFKAVMSKYATSVQAPQALYRLGQIGSDPAASAAAYTRLADEWPTHALAPAARYWAGESFFKAEQFPAASQQLARYLADHPKGKYASHATYTLAWSHFRQKHYPQAHTHFAAFSTRYPNHKLAPECALRAADALHKQGKHEAALLAYRPLTATGAPFRNEALLAMAWVLSDSGERTDSAAAFIDAAKAQGTSPLAATCWFNAGNAYVQSEAFDDAHQAFSQLLTPAFAKHELTQEARYWHAYTALKLGHAAQAMPALKALHAQLATTPDAPLAKRLPDILLSLAEACSASGDHKSSATTYAELAKTFSTHDSAPHAAYAAILEFDAAKQPQQAASAARAMMTAFPDHGLTPLARFALAEFAFRSADYAESLKILEPLAPTALPPELKNDYTYKRAWAAFHTKDFPQALTHFQSLAAATPPDDMTAEAAYMAGRTCESLKKLPDATRFYQQCATANPASPFAAKSRLAMAQIALDAKAYKQALGILEQLAPEQPPAVAHVATLYKGEALLALNRFNEAEAAYQAATNAVGSMGADAAYGMAWACMRRCTASDAQGPEQQLRDAKSAATAFAAVATADTNTSQGTEAAFWAARALETAATLAAPTENQSLFSAAAEAYATYLKRGTAPPSDDTPLQQEARYRQAFCLARAELRDRAATLYRVVAAGTSPFADNALYDHAWLELDAENNAAAQPLFESLIKRFPSSELAPDARFRLGTLAFDAKQYDQAVTHLELLTSDASPLPYTDKLLYKLAWAHRELEQTEKAATRFRQLAQKHPESPLASEAHYRAGQAFQKLKRPTDALVMFQAVPAAGSFGERALFHIGEIHRAAANTAAALAAYQQGLTQFPKGELTPQMTLGLAHCQRNAAAYADAIESYASVTAITDTIDAAHALIGSGLARMAMKQYKAATKDFLKVDILYGYDTLKPQALRELIVCYQKLGNAEKAAKYKQELQTRYPE
jgi:TolA-binding protein